MANAPEVPKQGMSPTRARILRRASAAARRARLAEGTREREDTRTEADYNRAASAAFEAGN